MTDEIFRRDVTSQPGGDSDECRLTGRTRPTFNAPSGGIELDEYATSCCAESERGSGYAGRALR
jgi:hypothetical protein